MSFFTHARVNKLIFFLLLLVMLVLLTGYAVAGWHSRYLADDYCYDAQFINHGFWKGQIDSYLNLMPYSSNRYSLTFFSGLAWTLGGVAVMPFIPGVMILLGMLALFYAIHQGTSYFSLRLPIITTAFIAASILFYTLLLASNRYQILYWRSGLLPYLFPLILNTFLVGRVFFYLQKQKFGILGFLELGFLAWIAAGFSETIFALQTGFWGLALLLTLMSRYANGQKAVVIILFGTLLGAVLLIVNPTNAIRQSPFPPPPPLWTVALTAIQYAKDFFFYTIRGTWLPLMALLGSGVLFGWLELSASHFQWRKHLAILLGMVLGTGMLLTCIMAPTIWSMSSYPEPRGLLSGTYLINLFLFSLGVWIGTTSAKLLQFTFSPRYKLLLGFLMMMALVAYSVRFIPTTYQLFRQYEDRAIAWDARNTQILNAKAEGVTSIIVPGIDSIAMIFELQPDENHWVNNCAEMYYQVSSIKAIDE